MKNKEYQENVKMLKKPTTFLMRSITERITKCQCSRCKEIDRLSNFIQWKKEPKNKEEVVSSLSRYLISSNEVDESLTSSDEIYTDKNVIRLICPSCKTDITFDKRVWLSKSTRSNFYFVGYSIFKNEDRNTLSVSLFYDDYYPIADKNLIIKKRYNNRIVFNTKTGQTYLMEMRHSDGNKQKASFWEAGRIQNITYSGRNSYLSNIINDPWINPILTNKQMIEDIGQALAEMKGIEIPEFYDDAASRHYRFFRLLYPIFNLITFNRFPEFNDDFYRTINSVISTNLIPAKKANPDIGYYDYLGNDFMKTLNNSWRNYIKKIQEPLKLYDSLCKKLNVLKKKKIKKLFFKNPFVAILYNACEDLGFTDYNVILSLVEFPPVWLLHVISFYNPSKMCFIDHNEMNAKADLVKRLIKVKGESSTVKILSRDSSDIVNLFNNTARMFYRLNENGLFEDNFMRGNFKEIHDKLSSNIKKIGRECLPIEYTDENYILEDKIDGVTFSLAKDTYYLIDVGAEMGICVGGYDWKALAHQCIIVTMRKGNKHVGCIELKGTQNPSEGDHEEDIWSSDYRGNTEKANAPYALIQVKGKSNNVIEPEVREPFLTWINNNSIITNNCYDWNNLKSYM